MICFVILELDFELLSIKSWNRQSHVNETKDLPDHQTDYRERRVFSSPSLLQAYRAELAVVCSSCRSYLI